MATLDLFREAYQHKNYHLLLRAGSAITAGQLVAYANVAGTKIEPHVFDDTSVTDSARIVGVALSNGATGDFVKVLIDGFFVASFTADVSANQVLFESANAGEFDLTQDGTAFRVAKMLQLIINSQYGSNSVNPSGLFYYGVTY